MRYYKCKCGDHEAWGSDPPSPCIVCKKCGTTLLRSEDGFIEPVSHKYVTKYNENTGDPYEICTLCYQKKKHIEEES